MKAYVSSFLYVLVYLAVSALLLVDIGNISFNTIFSGLIFAYIIGLIVGSGRDILFGAQFDKYSIGLFVLLGPIFYSVFSLIIHPESILENPLLVSLGASFTGILISRKSSVVKSVSTLLLVGLFFLYAYFGLYWR